MQPRQLSRSWVPVALVVVAVLAGPAWAFFPAATPPPNNVSGTGNQTGGVPGPPPPTPPPPVAPPPPPVTPPPPPPLTMTPAPAEFPNPSGVPELDPSSAASAIGLLVLGGLMLTDRRRRK